MAVLSASDIRSLINRQPPLIEGYADLDAQVQPNGFDITLREIFTLDTPGRIAVSNSERIVSGLSPLEFDSSGFIGLEPGIYSITYNEIVHLPNDIMALARPRSSLFRCGVSVGTAVWDAGYSGRSESLLTVLHPGGFTVQKNARVVQLVFMRLTGETEGYSGTYQNENIG
jgi:dUTP pyrophosphatase